MVARSVCWRGRRRGRPSAGRGAARAVEDLLGAASSSGRPPARPRAGGRPAARQSSAIVVVGLQLRASQKSSTASGSASGGTGTRARPDPQQLAARNQQHEVGTVGAGASSARRRSPARSCRARAAARACRCARGARPRTQRLAIVADQVGVTKSREADPEDARVSRERASPPPRWRAASYPCHQDQ